MWNCTSVVRDDSGASGGIGGGGGGGGSGCRWAVEQVPKVKMAIEKREAQGVLPMQLMLSSGSKM